MQVQDIQVGQFFAIDGDEMLLVERFDSGIEGTIGLVYSDEDGNHTEQVFALGTEIQTSGL